MNWAVINFSGKQYLVKAGSKIQVGNLSKDVGQTVTFDKILLAVNDSIKIGKPTIENFKILGKVIRKFAGPKIVVTKFKPKSRYLRRVGFRPKFTEIEIVRIRA